MTEVEEYFDGLDADSRDAFRRIRAIALEVAPDAEDGRSYGMPALRHGGRPLLGFRAAKEHLSVFPFSPAAVDAVRDRLSGFDLSKGTVRFTAGRPLPDDVVADLVRHRLTEITG
ncbi:iron chaperone [Streptomyces roseolus]|uniref:iron chaperone n=1 Tax=Streptomyces TaxID=1883 RepID=UPI0036EF0248